MKNVLLTCFGGPLSWEYYQDFCARGMYRIFLGDTNTQARARACVKDFITLLPGTHPEYCADLLKKAAAHDIRMIIPGSDEEAMALMLQRFEFEKAGVIVAVQDLAYAQPFSSKSAMYNFLIDRGFSVPPYKVFSNAKEFDRALEDLGYPHKPLVIKPDKGRGGRGIVLLTERPIPNKDGLNMMNCAFFKYFLDGATLYLVMDYLESVMYDIDVLRYANGQLFFGYRRRFHNVSKIFHGNSFEKNSTMDAYAKKLYAVFPTRYLIDYDMSVTADGRINLIEVNPRPSGSTISYLPLGVNLYHTLIRSYLDGVHEIPDMVFNGQSVFAFHHMLIRP